MKCSAIENPRTAAWRSCQSASVAAGSSSMREATPARSASALVPNRKLAHGAVGGCVGWGCCG